MKKENILFINFGGIGDEILFLPSIQAVRDKFKDAKITLCTEKRSRSIENLTDIIDELHVINQKNNRYFELLKLILWARFKNFDYIISSGSNTLIPILLLLMGAKNRIGFAGSKFTNLLTHKAKLNTQQYAAKMYFELVKDLTQQEFKLPHINITNKAEHINNSVLIHPGVSAMSRSKRIEKTFGGEKWAELIDKLLDNGKTVILAGGPDDKQVYDEIIAKMKNVFAENFIDYYGKTKNIIDLAKLIDSTDVLCCSDSAPMHIGVALDKKVVALFAPTDENKLIPNKENFIVVKNSCCDCRPCLWDKRQTTCSELTCLNVDTEAFVKAIG